MKGGLANVNKIHREKKTWIFSFFLSSSGFAFLINWKCHNFVIHTNSHHLWLNWHKNLKNIPLTSFSMKSSWCPQTQDYHDFHFRYTLNKTLTEMFSQTATQFYILSKQITKKTTPCSKCMTWFPTQALLYYSVDNWRPQRRALKGHVDPELNSPVPPFYSLIDSRQSEQKI